MVELKECPPKVHLWKQRKDNIGMWRTEEMRDGSERHILKVKVSALSLASLGKAQKVKENTSWYFNNHNRLLLLVVTK